MDGYSFVDIFATKGIEYLLVIGFLVIFIVFMRLLLADTHKARSSDRKHAHGKTR